MSSRLALSFACHQQWDELPAGAEPDSRFCESCRHPVIDFTAQSREEILRYLRERDGERVCGKFSRDQLYQPIAANPLRIKVAPSPASGSRLPFYLLAGSLLLTACQQEPRHKPEKEMSARPEDTLTPTPSTLSDTLVEEAVQETEPSSEQPHEYLTGAEDAMEIPNFVLLEPPPALHTPPTLGIIYEYIPGPVCELGGSYTFCHSYPQFPGGAQALSDYLQERVSKAMKRASFTEAKVVVQFEVDKTGRLKKPRIVSAPEGSKKLQKAVLKSFHRMPKWNPGKVYDDSVNVVCTIPFYFTN